MKTLTNIANCLAISLILACVSASAATLNAEVVNSKDKPVKDAVVYAVPEDSSVLKSVKTPKQIDVDQVDKEFIPYVTAVYQGTDVNFPNSDKIRHHVYSFSDAKRFEIPLYTGAPEKPVNFDKAGEVALGCNIHDWMKAYVFVCESPFFATTDASGKASLQNLPDGDYQVRVWHPTLRGKSEDTGQKVSVASGSAPQSLHFSIREKKLWRPWRAPSSTSGGYR